MAGLALIAAIGAAAGQSGPHPDVDLRNTHVDVRLSSRDEYGVAVRDVELARTITALAAAAHLAVVATSARRRTADPSRKDRRGRRPGPGPGHRPGARPGGAG